MNFNELLALTEDRIRIAQSREEIRSIVVQAGQTLLSWRIEPGWANVFWIRLRGRLNIAIKEQNHEDALALVAYALELISQSDDQSTES